MEEHSCQIEKSKNVDRMKEYENSISKKEKNIYERKTDGLKKGKRSLDRNSLDIFS
jgi:hypothetical protein